jgi:hypothetical protein
VPRPNRLDAERRVGGDGGAGPAEGEDLDRALARRPGRPHLVPGEPQARELQAAEQLGVLDEPGQPGVVGPEPALLEERGEPTLLERNAHKKAQAHLVGILEGVRS